jgi:hypothetical protein
MKRWTSPIRPALALLALLIGIAGSASAQVKLFVPNDRVSVYTEPTLNIGISDLEISCPVRGAELYIDKDYQGVVPDTGTFAISVQPGNHYLEIMGPGYYDLGIWMVLQEKTLYYLGFKPLRITGSISIQVEPPDASILLDGSPGDGGQVELPVGSHTLTVRRFGYVERSISVEVAENSTSYVSLSLEKAPFTIKKLAFSRSVFNPRNAGASGRTSLDFLASNYGSAQAEIRGPVGRLVATLDFPVIDSWSQSQVWNGRDQQGLPLPDGAYTATLIARPALGVEARAGELDADGTIQARAELRIDSSLVIGSFGTASGLPGLLYLPDTLAQPAGTVQTEAFWFAPWAEPQSSAVGLSAAFSLGGAATLTAIAATETGNSPTNGTDLAFSALFALFGDSTSTLSGGVLIKGGYSSATAPSLPGAASGVETSLPLALKIGDLSLSLAPGALLDLDSSQPAYLGLARAGLRLEGRSFRIGASGELPLSFAGLVPAPLWPARAALEGRLMIGSSPLVVSAYLDSTLEPDSPPNIGIGIGLGLLF